MDQSTEDVSTAQLTWDGSFGRALAAEHGELVAQDQEFEVLGGVPAGQERK